MTFKANYEGIGEMLNSKYMQEAMRRRADRGKEYAESVSPTDDGEDGHPGLYKSSFVVSSGSHGGEKHDRAYALLENTSPEAPYVEHGNGTAKYQGDHVLARALDVMKA